MFRKIFIIIISLASFFLFINFSYWANCELWWDVWTSLEWCLWWAAVLQSPDMYVESWFKTLIVSFVTKISTILAILAVWSIAYWSMVIVTSMWADDKITKWRNIIKWALIWFLVLVSAAWIIKLIIYIIYWL
jgi:hypothetical protein